VLYDVPVLYDPEFTPRELTTMHRECASWVTAVPSLQITESVGPCDAVTEGVCVMRVTEAEIHEAVHSDNVVAFTANRPGGKAIFLDPTSPATKPGVFAHELGHAMGLMHDSHRYTLMYAVQYCSILMDPCDAPRPTFRDAAQWYFLRLAGL
jgi:hypothetical protein